MSQKPHHLLIIYQGGADMDGTHASQALTAIPAEMKRPVEEFVMKVIKVMLGLQCVHKKFEKKSV